MLEIQSQISAEYAELSRTAAAGDPQKAGYGAEDRWVELLKGWLPERYAVDTRKYIVLEDGTESPEIDIVVFRPGCPPRLRTPRKVLAGGVAAAFSVKMTLKGDDLIDQINRGIGLKRGLWPRQNSTAASEVLPLFPYGILCHSHVWKTARPRKTPVAQISERLTKHQESAVRHPRELVDFVCVADTGCWATKRMTYISADLVRHLQPQPCITDSHRTHGAVLAAPVRITSQPLRLAGTSGMYGYGGLAPGDTPVAPPIAQFVTALLTRLSYQDHDLKPIAESLHLNGYNSWTTGPGRWWSAADVYSQRVLRGLKHDNSGFYTLD
ncbi:DUF6602 domain-containing protein [Catenulispora rubra]|uniref:DUF6602 domain-containing protein n=1 Tax=Catenulispora rubra TaxID=280293 RepID=UPI0018927B41|nr:DUF6602 domain-containing protein [Catenulispora rubra]